MVYNSKNPLIVQSDNTVLLEVLNPFYEEARDGLSKFAELEKSPEHVHTYKITPLSLWNACASGHTQEKILEFLEKYSKYDVPQNVAAEIKEQLSRYGRLRLERNNGSYCLRSTDPMFLTQIWNNKEIQPLLKDYIPGEAILLDSYRRGDIKQALIKFGFPVEDLAGYEDGDSLEINLLDIARSGKPFSLRDYQKDAVDVFYHEGSCYGGSGVIVLPCGAGKTLVGMGAIARLKTHTLILATHNVAVKQWIRELLDKTDISKDMIGEYTGYTKEIKPITIATYNIITHRKGKDSEFIHFKIFNEHNWGLIVYDEVHLLPAPVFRITAGLQAKRRLGLTATLIREDGCEEDVFSLIGPKKFDLPWKLLEQQGWIATAFCTEVRIDLPDDIRLSYAMSDPRQQFRIASENPAKLPIVKQLLEAHSDDQVLIIGQYISQITKFAQELSLPIITGKTPLSAREELYEKFRKKEIKTLIVSKVGNFSIDLPEANVLIQVSGTFGSRQEEAQRLGRILRPKCAVTKECAGGQARFYTLVTRDTFELDFSRNRQLFLTEQGYSYEIKDADELLKMEYIGI